MKDIRIYDFNFNLLSIMSDIISSSWTIKYNDIGTYEGHFRLSDRISDILLNNQYIILVEGDKQAVCTGKIAENDLLICGRTLNWLLRKRALPPFKTREIFGSDFQDPKTILDYILTLSYISPPQTDEEGFFIEGTVNTKKSVENFNLSPYIHSEKMDRYFWRNSANTLDEIVCDLCNLMGVGHQLYFNVADKSWDFKILTGNSKDIFLSQKHNNFFSYSYTEDIENYAHSGWYDDGLNSETNENIWRYIDSESDNCGMLYWESVLGGLGESEARSSLQSKQKEIIIQGQISRLEFGMDYNLGDTLRILVTFGKFQKTFIYKVTGINLWRNEGNKGQEPILKLIKEEI